MIFLSGTSNAVIDPILIEHGIGLMVQPRSGYGRRIPQFSTWAADNGCFNPKTYKGHEGWLQWLDKLPRERCLFAVVPDVSRRPDGSLGGDPVATWALFEEYAEVVRSMGFLPALAAQDGLELLGNAREQIAACDCLFIAGSTEWKVSDAAARLADEARRQGKWVHMGRANTFGRFERALSIGCNSSDGTLLKYGFDANFPKLVRWLNHRDTHQMLSLFTGYETPSHPTHREAVSQ